MRLFNLLLIFLLSILTTVPAYSHHPDIDLNVGIAKTRYVYVGTTINNHYSIFISESLYSESFKNQQIEVTGLYQGSFRNFSYSGGVSIATSWCGSYQRYSATAALGYRPFDRLMAEVKLHPEYDTGYRYHTDWSASIKFKACKPLQVNLDYTTIPDYRKSEKRMHIGTTFTSGALSASFAISIPLEGDQKFRTWRILTGFNYCFNLSKSPKKIL